MTTQAQSDVSARTVPFIVEMHYFGEHRKATMANVHIEGVEPDEDESTEAAEERVKALHTLTKRIINSPETRAIRQHDSTFRRYLTTVATPFRPGVWLVPVGLVEAVYEKAEAWAKTRLELVAKAKAAYPGHVAAMEKALGPQYNALDYPTVERFSEKFYVNFRYTDFGVPGVLKAINADVFKRESAKVKQEAEQAKVLIEQHLATSLLAITEHLTTLLKAPRADGKAHVLRDRSFDRLLAFIDTFAVRDVTDFKALKAVTDKLKRTVRNGADIENDIQNMRDDAAFRAIVAAQIEEAKNAVAALVTEGPTRAIYIPDEADVA